MLVVANWKAYVSDLQKAKKLVATAKKLSSISSEIDIVIAPPSPFLGLFARGNRSRIGFAAQDISTSPGGAMTGEVPAQCVASSGASYVIVGHSERRSIGDTKEVVAEKIVRALACNLTPILCVGESERDGEGRYLGFVREEIVSALSGLSPKERARIVIAYEPLWAIGKNAAAAANPSDLTEMVLYIRKVLSELLPGKGSTHSVVLYGGSVEPENIRGLAAGSGVDGFLIGHASVEANIFAMLVKQLS